MNREDNVLAEWDTEAGLSYLSISDRPVVTTRHFGDLVSVDLDEHGEVVGVELLVPLPQASHLLEPVLVEYPHLAERLP